MPLLKYIAGRTDIDEATSTVACTNSLPKRGLLGGCGLQSDIAMRLFGTRPRMGTFAQGRACALMHMHRGTPAHPCDPCAHARTRAHAHPRGHMRTCTHTSTHVHKPVFTRIHALVRVQTHTWAHTRGRSRKRI